MSLFNRNGQYDQAIDAFFNAEMAAKKEMQQHLHDTKFKFERDLHVVRDQRELFEALRRKKEWIQMKILHAHRSYMHAMSKYKMLRYGI